MDDDEEIARRLQEEFYAESLLEINDELSIFLPSKSQLRDSLSPVKAKSLSIVAPEWEDIDPTPDLHALFLQYNDQFFWGKLVGCEVKWSPRMTLCAGVCSYQRRAGYCSIRLSVPLLKLRPRKDFVETLLHEMIHAYLFVTDGNDDHDGHGPAFHEHMFRINKATGTNISVYHNFHDEVDAYRTHWWQCDGPCKTRKPFFGLVKRAMNRAPGPNDRWWADHQNSCGGTYTKVKEPENFGKKKRKKDTAAAVELPPKGQKDIRSFGTASKLGSARNTHSQQPASTITSGSESAISLSNNSQSSSEDSVQSQLRKVWAKKFEASTAADVKTTAKIDDFFTTTSVLSTDEKKRKLVEKKLENTICPVCDKQVKSFEINSHLDSCLSESTPPKASSSKSNPFVDEEEGDCDSKELFKKTRNNDVITLDGSTFPCPVCQKEVYSEEMNRHLDFCAAS